MGITNIHENYCSQMIVIKIPGIDMRFLCPCFAVNSSCAGILQLEVLISTQSLWCHLEWYVVGNQ